LDYGWKICFNLKNLLEHAVAAKKSTGILKNNGSAKGQLIFFSSKQFSKYNLRVLKNLVKI